MLVDLYRYKKHGCSGAIGAAAGEIHISVERVYESNRQLTVAKPNRTKWRNVSRTQLLGVASQADRPCTFTTHKAVHKVVHTDIANAGRQTVRPTYIVSATANHEGQFVS